MPHPVERYLRSMGEIRRTGAAVPETSYYGVLEALLNEVGGDLSPRVLAVLTLRDEGAGIPDGGLFTADQVARDIEDPVAHVLPGRGVVEVKGPDTDVFTVAGGEQVARYADRYGQVLVTNYRSFLLVARERGGVRRLEPFELAPDSSAFWGLTGRPTAAARERGDELVEYLKRVMLWPAPIREPADLAWLLASYAREGLRRVEGSHLAALERVREALEEALGVDFRGQRGEHFFHSTLVQTLFYGIFSAWVLWHREDPDRTERFDWRLAEWSLRVPMIRALFEHVATATHVEELGLTEILDWASSALNRVERESFFQRFREQNAVQYFYEPFLEAFDPDLRKQLGVWYTPPEVVQYMVERVDRALRDDLGIADGLADDRVVVLDPCCGTGAYLVEVLDRIGRTLRERGEGALVGAALRRAASERVFGFEILPAPFVVSHLQLGLLLHQHASGGERQRVGVYLTNALTGWVEDEDTPLPLLPELEQERDAADHIKRDERILVVLGNPPYNGYAGMGMDEERDLVESYRRTERAPKPQGQGLNDLYVRFYRMAERRISEMTGRGVVCFITNYSWLDGLSFTGMRERFIDAFDRIAIDSLNGDKYRTGKLTPDGDPDPSVFSTERNREGIQVGTAIATLVRQEPHQRTRGILFRNFWGRRKRIDLLASLEADAHSPEYEVVEPVSKLGFPFRQISSGGNYLSWPLLPDLMPVSFPGVKTSRDDLVVDIDREALEGRIRLYCDATISDREMGDICSKAMTSTQRFDAPGTRRALQQVGYQHDNIAKYVYRPFDLRWIYWEPTTKLLDEKRSDYVPHICPGNLWIEARQRYTQEHFDRGYVVQHLADNFGNGLSHFFPLRVEEQEEQQGLFGAPVGGMEPNLSPQAAAYLRRASATPRHLFHHIIATLHTPDYATENGGALRQDWPRIPLPENRETLVAGAELGEELARLLDPEREAPGVSSGRIREELRALGVVRRVGDGELDEDDLALTAGWGYSGARGAVMPGRGNIVERDYTDDERAALAAGTLDLGLSEGQALGLLGERTLDVYLNDVAFWSNVPVGVWEYTLGGYPVVKKWLSYRERDVLGRDLKLDEVRYVTEMVRRIAAILLMGPSLDAHYAAAKEATVAL